MRDLAVANITTTSADVSWTDSVSNSGTSEWEVSYGVSGFPVGSGTESIVTSPSAALSGLVPAISYDVYVRAICGAGDTSAWSTVAFTTACGAYSAPYVQDFDASGLLPTCWDEINGGTADNWLIYSGQSQSGTNAAGIYTDVNGGNDDDYLITPGFIVTGNQQLTYSYSVFSASEPPFGT